MGNIKSQNIQDYVLVTAICNIKAGLMRIHKPASGYWPLTNMIRPWYNRFARSLGRLDIGDISYFKNWKQDNLSYRVNTSLLQPV